MEGKFGKNEKGRGHWREVEFIRNRLLHYFPTNFKMTTKTKQPILNMIRSNSNHDLATFPVYVLRYKNQDNTARMEKVCSCGDTGIFSNTNPCVLLLNDEHFLSVWDYASLFNEIDCPTLNEKKQNKGSDERYKK